MDLIDSKYIGLVSSRLQKFKRVKADLYNFRCPICGDSQRNKTKARGYLYPVKNNTNFKCHNCGASLSFNNFLKELDPTLHKQYTLEKFKEGHTGKNFVVEEPKFEFAKPVFKKKLDLPKASEVPIAKEYLEKRKLNPEKFYFADKFKQWTNTQKVTFDTIGRDESRIIIPLYDVESNLIGFQGRALGPSPNKYITVMLSNESPKLYGLEKVDSSKTIYIVEGPFDSTLVENAIAMCGSDVDIRSFGWSDYIWVFDNEPRNREIVNRISKTINRGDKVIIWPTSIQQKDINDMILAGLNVMDVLKSNTYSGLEAKIKFNNWKKI
jgi:transcription initiation factor IIE alpha subunit